jgi:hypothetical protein
LSNLGSVAVRCALFSGDWPLLVEGRTAAAWQIFRRNWNWDALFEREVAEVISSRELYGSLKKVKAYFHMQLSRFRPQGILPVPLPMPEANKIDAGVNNMTNQFIDFFSPQLLLSSASD